MGENLVLAGNSVEFSITTIKKNLLVKQSGQRLERLQSEGNGCEVAVSISYMEKLLNIWMAKV